MKTRRTFSPAEVGPRDGAICVGVLVARSNVVKRRASGFPIDNAVPTFRSRPVSGRQPSNKWRASQDKSANTYAIEVAM